MSKYSNLKSKLFNQSLEESGEDAVSELCTWIIDHVGVGPLMMAIPDDWEYPESFGGDNPTKKSFVFTWLWQELTTLDDEDAEEYFDDVDKSTEAKSTQRRVTLYVELDEEAQTLQDYLTNIWNAAESIDDGACAVVSASIHDMNGNILVTEDGSE